MGNCTSTDIHIPVITCLCEALIMSIIINIYFICTRKKRELGQQLYKSVTSVFCCDKNEPQSEPQPAEQDEAEEDIQYSTLDFVQKTAKDRKRQREKENEETLYAGVASLGVE